MVGLFTPVSQCSAQLLLGLLDAGAPASALQVSHADSLEQLLEALLSETGFDLLLRVETFDDAASGHDFLVTCQVEQSSTLQTRSFFEALERQRPGLAAQVLTLISDTSVLLPVYTPVHAYDWLESLWWDGSWDRFESNFRTQLARELGCRVAALREHDVQRLLDDHSYSRQRVTVAIPESCQTFAAYDLDELLDFAHDLPFLTALLELLAAADTLFWESVLSPLDRLDNVWAAYPLVLETSEHALVNEMWAEAHDQGWQEGLMCAFATFLPPDAGAFLDLVAALNANTKMLRDLRALLANFTCLETL